MFGAISLSICKLIQNQDSIWLFNNNICTMVKQDGVAQSKLVEQLVRLRILLMMILLLWFSLIASVLLLFRCSACETCYKMWQQFCKRNFYPQFNTNKCYSMFRLGFKSFVAGIPCRPALPNQDITMKFVWSYLQRLNGSIALHKPIFSDNVNCLCWFEEIEEKSSRQRLSLNATFMRRLRSTRDGGG